MSHRTHAVAHSITKASSEGSFTEWTVTDGENPNGYVVNGKSTAQFLAWLNEHQFRIVSSNHTKISLDNNQDGNPDTIVWLERES